MVFEQARLRSHFRGALADVSAHDGSHLAAPERRTRERLLAELARYARRGRFPKNRDFVEMTPYFVDADGTRCAVAHLVEATGERGLVERIVATNNNALVPELARDPALRAWLRAVGLTVAEAARIQPTYCSYSKDTECFCGPAHSRVSPVTGVLEVTALAAPTNGYLQVMVDQIHGEAPGIIVAQTITVGSYVASRVPQAGDALLVPVGYDAAMTTLYDPAFHVGELVELACHLNVSVPALTKEDAIQAAFGTASDCESYLEHLNSDWGAKPCEEPGAGGDGCSASGANTLFGALFAAALASRVRRSRR
jgi:hypothetical protein